MKVLVGNAFYYLRGGSERSAFDISELLVSEGHEVIPFSMVHPLNMPTPNAEYFVSYIDYPELLGSMNPVNVIKATERVLYSRESRDKLAQLIEITQPDLAHLHNIAHELSPSVFYTLSRANIPIVQTVHDYKLVCPNTSFISHGELCERCLGGKFYHVVLRRCKRGSLPASALACIESYTHHWLRTYERKVDTFIAPSIYVREKLIEAGFEAEKIAYLPHMIDTTRFHPAKEPGHYVLYFGRLVREKGLFTLVEAMNRHSIIPLKIAGEGPLSDELFNFVKRKNMGNVEFLGYQKGEVLHDLIRNSAFVVIPSEWPENAPYACYESMALGRAVIGAMIGGIPELVQESVTGLLFEPGNSDDLAEKVEFLFDHPSLQVEWGYNARKRVETTFRPKQYYQSIMEIYDRLLAKASARVSLQTL